MKLSEQVAVLEERDALNAATIADLRKLVDTLNIRIWGYEQREKGIER